MVGTDHGRGEDGDEDSDVVEKIAEKTLRYKKKLAQVPTELIPVAESEQDREEVNELYPHTLDSPQGQLLDSQFYSQLLAMNRERDKSFLREGTTRKERVAYLADYMQRMTTPVFWLNHPRHIQLTDLWQVNRARGARERGTTSSDVAPDPDRPEDLGLFSDQDLQELRRSLVELLVGRDWTREELESELSHWEADVFSQLTRDGQLVVTSLDSGTRFRIAASTDPLPDARVLRRTRSVVFEPRKN